MVNPFCSETLSTSTLLQNTIRLWNSLLAEVAQLTYNNNNCACGVKSSTVKYFIKRSGLYIFHLKADRLMQLRIIMREMCIV